MPYQGFAVGGLCCWQGRHSIAAARLAFKCGSPGPVLPLEGSPSVRNDPVLTSTPVVSCAGGSPTEAQPGVNYVVDAKSMLTRSWQSAIHCAAGFPEGRSEWGNSRTATGDLLHVLCGEVRE